VHLRRALILFAVVLALAALAASVSEPRRARERESPPVAKGAPPPHAASAPRMIVFTADGPHRTRRLRVGDHVGVVVRASEPGEVELGGLGLSAPVDPATPARFDVLAERPQKVSVLYTPSGTSAPGRAGTLAISERGSARSGGRSSRTTAPDR
jgi:hypothetical protein